MASWTCLLFLTLFCIISGCDFSVFVHLECNEDSHGRLGQQSLLECIVKGSVQIERVERIIWKKEKTALIEYKRGINLTSKPGFTLAEPRWNETNLNVSMLVANTMMADMGKYTCIVVTNRGHCSSSITLGLSATDSSPTTGVTENPQKDMNQFCEDGICNIEPYYEAPSPDSRLASKVVPPVVVVLVIIGLLFFLKRQCNKRTHAEIPTDNKVLCNGEHQPNMV